MADGINGFINVEVTWALLAEVIKERKHEQTMQTRKG